ncbi:hypothetical protein D3C72_1354270 [compost metagenome]
MAKQFADQFVAERQIGLHRQRPSGGLGVKRGGHECLVDRRNQRPTDFASGQLRVWMTGLPGRQKHFGQTPGVRTITTGAGVNSKNSTHLSLLRAKLKRLVVCSLRLTTVLAQMSRNQSG